MEEKENKTNINENKQFEEEKNVSEKSKENHKKVSKREYDALSSQFEKAMATAAHHQNLANYYKNEYDKMLKYKSQSVIEAILPSLDAFELAFKYEAKSDETKSYKAGFEFVYKMLVDHLISEGLVILTPKINDEFDSNTMQIIDTKETLNKDEENKVYEVSLNGYMIKDRLIRPASVKVYTLKKEKEEKEESNLESDESKN